MRKREGVGVGVGGMVAALVIGLLPGVVIGTTVTERFTCARDTLLSSFYVNTPHGDSIAFGVGGYGAAEKGRVLIGFDLSAIPRHATILSATLKLVFTGNQNGTESTTISIYRVTNSWTESGATWNSRDGSADWAVAGGGDHLAAASSSLTSTFAGSLTDRVDFDFTSVLADVQYWFEHPTENHGWIVMNSEEVALAQNKQMTSREWPNNPPAAPTYLKGGQPILEVVYNVPDALVRVSLDATQDAGLESGAPTVNAGSYLAFSVGNYNASLLRHVVGFDVSSIPSDANIVSATLRLVFTGNADPAYSTKVLVYRLTNSWTEGEATWNKRDSIHSWTIAGGGDRLTAPSDWITSYFAGSLTARVDFPFSNVVADVREWVEHPENNCGWVVINNIENDAGNHTFKQITTREWPGEPPGDPSWFHGGQPILDVDYIPVRGSVVVIH